MSLLLAARVLMSGQRAFVGVIVPVYLARRGYSATRIGVVFAAVALTAAVLSLLAGAVADRVGRRTPVIVLPLVAVVAGVVFASTGEQVALIVAASLGSYGRGSGAGAANVGPYQPAEQALLAGLVPDEERNRLFSVVASASALGGLLGAVLAASPLGAPTSTVGAAVVATYRVAFVTSAVLALLAGLLAVGVREPRPSAASTPNERRDSGAVAEPAAEDGADQGPVGAAEVTRRRPLSESGRRLVHKLWLTNATNGVAVGLFGPFVSYWLYRRYGVGTTEIGEIFIGVNVVTIATNLAAAPVASRLGVVRTVVVARTAQALLLVPLALSPTVVVAGVVYALRTCVQRIGLALRQSFVMGEAPPEERARVAALSQLPSQGLSGVAPLFTGYLFDEVSLAAPFEIAAVFQLANALSFGWLFRSRDEPGAAVGSTVPDTTPEAHRERTDHRPHRG